jgi:membrane-bound lytic murein transglycosylase D
MCRKNTVKTIVWLGIWFLLFASEYISFAQPVSVALQVKDTVAQAAGSSTPVPQSTVLLSTKPLPYQEALVVDQLACLEQTIPLRYNKTVQKTIQALIKSRRNHTQAMLMRQQMYFPLFEEALARHNLPAELKYLPVVESALNPRAVSPAKAAGLWQFMPSIGRAYGLQRDMYMDERMDPYKATNAACHFLKSLHTMFGDWELALAAYNAGPGRVRRAIRRSGNKTSLAAIYSYLPRETRGYVPTFVAITYVMNYHETYGIYPDSLALHVPFDTIQVGQALDIAGLAKQLDIPLKEFQWLNPHLKRNIIPAYLKNYTLFVPKRGIALLVAQRQAIMAAAAPVMRMRNSRKLSGGGTRKIMHAVRRGETINQIAAVYQVAVKSIRRWNSLSSNYVKKGRRLVVWVPVKPTAKPVLSSVSGVNVVAVLEKIPLKSKAYLAGSSKTILRIAIVPNDYFPN